MKSPTPKRNERNANRLNVRRHIANRKAGISYAMTFSVSRMYEPHAQKVSLPEQIVLLRIAEGDASQDQLFLDRIPVPRNAWKLHPHDQTLTWKGVFGGGHIQLAQDLLSGSGVIGAALKSASVDIRHVNTFTCDVARGAGTGKVIDGNKIIDLQWKPDTKDWNDAPWISQALQIDTIEAPSSSPGDTPVFWLTFTDLETLTQWQPDKDAQVASIAPKDDPNGGMGWHLSFSASARGVVDNRSGLKGPNDQTIDTVFPFLLKALEDAAASSITGAILIDSNTTSGVTCGIRGQRIQANATGYYQWQERTAGAGEGEGEGEGPLVFGIFNGRVYIDNVLVPNCRLIGNQLIGLDKTGPLYFDEHGTTAVPENGQPVVQRLALEELSRLLDAQEDKYKTLTSAHAAVTEAANDSGLNVYDLITFTSQVMKTPTDQNGNPLKDKNGNPLPPVWVDVIQQKVTQDLSAIMNASIPSAMWSRLYGNLPQTSLDNEQQRVANSPVKGVDNPRDWYASLAVAVMTQGLAQITNNGNAARLNAPRAQRWLKEQTAVSPVYHTHGQELFYYHWEELYPDSFPPFIKDQQSNIFHSVDIAVYIEQQLSLISKVAVSASSDGDMIATMTKQVKDLGGYAQTNRCYWALALYNHLTLPGSLNVVADELGGASEDSSRLTRFYQQYMTLLTSLDDTGFFAKQYLQTFQTYLATHTIPSMVDLSGDGYSEEMISRLVTQFVSDNLESNDPDVRDFAIELQELVRNDDQLIHDAVGEMRELAAVVADAQSFPQFAAAFAQRFADEHQVTILTANAFVSVLLCGGSILSAFSLIQSIEDWDDLSDEMKAEVCINSSQLVLQIVTGLLSRSINWYNVFATDGLSNFQRASSVFKILFGANPDELGVGLNRISGSMARWMAGAAPEGEAALAAGGVAVAEEVSIAERVFGSSMSDFVATRLGTVFALAGMGFSLYHLFEGDTGLDAAADYVGYFGSALAVFAAVGGWALEGAISAEAITTITGVAGALSIACALAGLGILLYEMLTAKPDDPVEDFVNDDAQKAGFAMPGKCSAIDYAVQYNDPDQNNLGIMGFQLILQTAALVAQSTGEIALNSPDHSFATVWNVDTDGSGNSIVSTMIDRNDGNGLVTAVLSQMTTGDYKFLDDTSKDQQAAKGIATQRWSIQNTGTATLAGGQFLKTLPVTLTPVGSSVKGHDTVYTLTMAGRAPGAMKMRDLSFILNSQTITVFKPVVGQIGSAPNTFSLTGSQPLPAFLDFDPATGSITQNDNVPTATMPPTEYTLEVKNPLGSTTTNFKIEIITGTTTII